MCIYIYIYLYEYALFYVTNCNNIVMLITLLLPQWEQLFQPGWCAKRVVLYLFGTSQYWCDNSMHECFDMDMRDSSASLPHCVA